MTLMMRIMEKKEREKAREKARERKRESAPLPRYPPEKKPKNPSWGPQNLTSRGYGHSKTRSGEFLLKQIF